MEQDVFNPLKAVFRFILFFLFITTIYVLLFVDVDDSLGVCSDGTNLYLLSQEDERRVFLSKSPVVKEALHCAGKLIPFYSRSIDLHPETHINIKNAFKTRYSIINHPDVDYQINEVSKNVYILEKQGTKMVIVAKNNVSPFDYQNELLNAYMLITPNQSAIQHDLIVKSQVTAGFEWKEVEKGKIMRLRL